jgi:hypothetical protein
MHPVDELKQLREVMVEQLTQIPEYQALKAMERFIGELTNIYEPGSIQSEAAHSVPQKPTPVAVETRKSDLGSASPRVTPYIPAHRVA